MTKARCDRCGLIFATDKPHPGFRLCPTCQPAKAKPKAKAASKQRKGHQP